MDMPALLLVLPLVMAIAVPWYLHVRRVMTKPYKRKKNFSRKRIIKLTAINLSLNILTTLYIFLVYVRLFPYLEFNTMQLVLSVLLLLFVVLTFYGSGMYITSIVIEAYTKSELRWESYFKTQHIAIQLFHGILSHFFMFSGWMEVFLILGLLDVLRIPDTFTSPLQSLIIGGIVTGFLYAVAQIRNGTSPYQCIIGITSFCLFVYIILKNNVILTFFPIGLFSFAILATFSVTLLFYFVLLQMRGRKIVWDGTMY